MTLMRLVSNFISNNDTMIGYSQISLKEIVQSLTAVPWSGDPFQTPMVVTALCSLKAIDCENEKFVKAIENLLEQSKYVTEMMVH